MSVPGVLYGYSVFLMGGGLTGFAMAGFEAKAKTSLIVGGASSLCALACAVMSTTTDPPPVKGEAAYKRWMIGVHLGLVLPALLTPIFVWRATKAFAVPEKEYLGRILTALALGSAVTLYLLVKMKPKKDKEK